MTDTEARYRAAYAERFPPDLVHERNAPPWTPPAPADPDDPRVVARRVRDLLEATAEWDGVSSRPHLRVA